MRSIFVLLSACSAVAQATECQVAEETTMLQARRSVQKRMKATDTQGLNAQGLVKSLEDVANNFASMTTDDVNQALADAAEALATLSSSVQEQVGILQDTVNHAAAAVESCHGDAGVVQRAALWEAAEAQAAEVATCEAELATAVADWTRICSDASIDDVQSECACNEALVRKEDKEELCATHMTAYEFAYCEHNLQCNSYHDCHDTETAVYNQVKADVEAEMVPVEAEYVAAEQSKCMVDLINAGLAAGAIDFVAIAACSAVDTSSLLLVYPVLSAAPDACPGATTGSPPCVADGWELIVHQTVPNWFPSSARTTFNFNEGDSSADPFMKVGDLTSSNYLIDGKYHLRVVFGVVAEQSATCNDGAALTGASQEFEWTQTSWITETTITGFEAVSSADLTTSPHAGCQFHGLAKSSTGATVFDGTPDHGNWYTSVGSTQQWAVGIPAFKGGAAQTVSLYISR